MSKTNAAIVAGALVLMLALGLLVRRADVTKCEAVCARATLACAAQQSGPGTSQGILACESLGKMCNAKCEADMKFRAGMIE